MHQVPDRMVELDPLTHKPKRRRPYVQPQVRTLNLEDTPNTVALYETARDHRRYQNGEAVFARSLRLAIYASNLNDAIAGISVPGGDPVTGREPQATGELDEQRTRRANLENVAKGAARCVEAHCMGAALVRLVALFVDLGIPWEDRA